MCPKDDRIIFKLSLLDYNDYMIRVPDILMQYGVRDLHTPSGWCIQQNNLISNAFVLFRSASTDEERFILSETFLNNTLFYGVHETSIADRPFKGVLYLWAHFDEIDERAHYEITLTLCEGKKQKSFFTKEYAFDHFETAIVMLNHLMGQLSYAWVPLFKEHGVCDASLIIGDEL